MNFKKSLFLATVCSAFALANLNAAPISGDGEPPAFTENPGLKSLFEGIPAGAVWKRYQGNSEYYVLFNPNTSQVYKWDPSYNNSTLKFTPKPYHANSVVVDNNGVIQSVKNADLTDTLFISSSKSIVLGARESTIQFYNPQLRILSFTFDPTKTSDTVSTNISSAITGSNLAYFTAAGFSYVASGFASGAVFSKAGTALIIQGIGFGVDALWKYTGGNPSVKYGIYMENNGLERLLQWCSDQTTYTATPQTASKMNELIKAHPPVYFNIVGSYTGVNQATQSAGYRENTSIQYKTKFGEHYTLTLESPYSERDPEAPMFRHHYFMGYSTPSTSISITDSKGNVVLKSGQIQVTSIKEGSKGHQFFIRHNNNKEEVEFIIVVKCLRSTLLAKTKTDSANTGWGDWFSVDSWKKWADSWTGEEAPYYLVEFSSVSFAKDPDSSK